MAAVPPPAQSHEGRPAIGQCLHLWEPEALRGCPLGIPDPWLHRTPQPRSARTCLGGGVHRGPLGQISLGPAFTTPWCWCSLEGPLISRPSVSTDARGLWSSAAPAGMQLEPHPSVCIFPLPP